MAHATVTWFGGKQFVGVDSSKHAVVMSTQDEANGTGMKPSDLLLVALAGCTAVDVVGILEKKRQRITGLTVTVTGEQEPDPPWPYRTMHLHYEVRGRGLREKAVRDAIELSEQKYCSVAATLRPAAEITVDYTITEDD